MIKPSKVVFIDDDLEKKFYLLSDEDFIKKSIIQAIKNLKTNAFRGQQIAKRLIPKKYTKKYEINNLWKYNLPQGWRLLYTITADDEIKLITAILEWSNHKDYEKLMKY